MAADRYNELFKDETLEKLLPPTRSDEFFEALYGDADEGAYDISLAYVKADEKNLEFELRLKQRPGKCLACNLTYGLPEVFSRHPLINIKGIVAEIEKLLGGEVRLSGWKIGHTREKSRQLHAVPLILTREV
jgi:hypothetical protein